MEAAVWSRRLIVQKLPIIKLPTLDLAGRHDYILRRVVGLIGGSRIDRYGQNDTKAASRISFAPA